MSEEITTYSGFITIDLSLEKEKEIIISLFGDGTAIDDSTSYSYLLINRIFWDGPSNIDNFIKLEPYSPGEAEVVVVNITNSTGHYETPEGALYQRVIIPKEAEGVLTFYYNIQNDENIVSDLENDKAIGVQMFSASADLYNYISIISITFEVSDFYAEDEAKYVNFGTNHISLIDNRARTYYSPNFDSFELGTAVRAYVYGYYYKESEEEALDDL